MASRLVASAKSWLCHPGVDRSAAILPWGDGDGPKLSPVTAQALVSATSARRGPRAPRRAVRRAGGGGHRAGVVRRGGARADAAGRARGRAIRRSCCSRSRRPRSTLDRSARAARRLAPGERILVFDVGGGTTDFTLIAVDAGGDGFTRTAVGDHLLLGGDNIDLALAKLVEQRVAAKAARARRAAVARPRPRVPAGEGDAAR